MNCVVELVPPRTLPRTSSGKLSRSKARISICQARFSPTTSPPDVEVVRWEGLGGVWRSGSLPPTVSKITPQSLFTNLAYLCRERVQTSCSRSCTRRAAEALYGRTNELGRSPRKLWRDVQTSALPPRR